MSCTAQQDVSVVYVDSRFLLSITSKSYFDRKKKKPVFLITAYLKQEVSLKKIIVEGYRAVPSLNDSFQSCCCSLLISVSGKTYKLAINRPIKIRTHHVVR